MHISVVMSSNQAGTYVFRSNSFLTFERGCKMLMGTLQGRQSRNVLNSIPSLASERILDVLDHHGSKGKKKIYASLMQDCIKTKALALGKQIHAHLLNSHYRNNTFLANTLVNMYSKCGSLLDARRVFDKMPERNLFTWNIMISGYSQHGHSEEAFQLFQQMQQEGWKPNRITFISLLNACMRLSALEQGKKFHDLIVKSGIETDAIVGSALINMYVKCGSIELARQIFDIMPERGVVLYNAMIGGYAQSGHTGETLKLLYQMECEGLKPDRLTFLSMLKLCVMTTDWKMGLRIHAMILESELMTDAFLGSTLIDMYAKCGSIERACQMFNENYEILKQDVVSWNVMIEGYAWHGQAGKALELFWQMESEGVKPDKVTFASLFKACASVKNYKQGKEIHEYIIESGFEIDIVVRNALLDMYGKCGNIRDALKVFNGMPEKDVISWTSMITGHAEHGHSKEALQLFQQMEHEGVKPDKVTFISILKACTNLMAFKQGKWIHSLIIRSGLDSDVFVGNALIDMYSKCGSLNLARQVFDKMPKKVVVSWNTIIAGYSKHGLGIEALGLFDRMQQERVKPDYITFNGILSACSFSGLVPEGCSYFNKMSQEHAILPTDEHFTCMVDLLGHAGHLEEAEYYIKRMPFQPTSMVWSTLLDACKIHGNMKLAKHAADCIVIGPHDAGACVLLSNICIVSDKVAS